MLLSHGNIIITNDRSVGQTRVHIKENISCKRNLEWQFNKYTDNSGRTLPSVIARK